MSFKKRSGTSPQKPTCSNIRIRSPDDAHKIFFGVHCGTLSMVTRRLDSNERATIQTGSVYVWEESDASGIGIERWTDGKRWGPSRVQQEFLVYEETDNLEEDGIWSTRQLLAKKTYSAFVQTNLGRRKWHLCTYFEQSMETPLGTVDEIVILQSLVVPLGMFVGARSVKPWVWF
ncbi:Gti1/Pac2 family-domain-containing protein [Favolaschia claudopus]|uniref:Gti1/Pac2 family-domain-containing protein n=1 Tax=Favolaschia claudopus TaxID=2862362 RepID=A0AAW0A953_9AGAR